MRLLFLNALKGLKRKMIQMIGLIVLIMTSTGIFTMMNSTLDRMDDMAYSYIEKQQVEHATIMLNNRELLTREDFDILFPELQEEAFSIVTSDEFKLFKSEEELRLAPLVKPDAGLTNKQINDTQIAIRKEIKEEYGVTSLTSELEELASARLVNYYNSQAYLAKILSDKDYVVKDVDVYMMYGSQSSAKITRGKESVNSNPARVWYHFMPLNPQKSSSSSSDGCSGTTGIPNLNSLPPAFMKLYERYNMMMLDANLNVYLEEEVNEVCEKYHLKKQYRSEKDVTYKFSEDDEKSTVLATTAYLGNEVVNIPYLVDGSFPVHDNEITLSPNYLEKNNLKVGDNFKIKIKDNFKEYKIVGSAYIPDYIYPGISFNTPLYDEAFHSVCYTTPNTYDELVGIESSVYSIRFEDFKGEYGSDELDAFFDELKNEEKISFALPSYKMHPRIAMYLMQTKNNRVMTQYLMAILLAISIFIIVMVMKKKIDDEKRQIGVLKSLGYGTMAISVSYLVYPIVGSIIGGILGYILGICLQIPVVKLFRSYFNIPYNEFNFGFKYLGLSILIPLVTLTILSFLVALYMLRHRPLKLLQEGSNLKVNRTTKVITKLTSKLPFKSRFKYSIASRSLGKLFSITLSSFATGLLIVLTLIGSNMMNNFVSETFEGATYDYKVSFQTMQDSAHDAIDHSGEDTVLTQNLSIIGVIKDGEKQDLKKTRQLSCFGVDEDLKMVKITDAKKKDISGLLHGSGNNIIINDPVRTLYKLDVGDQVILTRKVNSNTGESCGEAIVFNVVGLNTTFSGMNCYVNKNVLTKYLGYNDTVYNEVWTNSLANKYSYDNKEIQSIFSLDDLKKNIEVALEMMNLSIYLVVAFAGVMALVIISVVSSIVIDENKKHISLMKVMGYKEKEINSIVLNIYTPFVIIAYFLSIPAMKAILNFIISLVVKDLDFTIPIRLGWINALIGLTVILVAYFIALFAARKALNKVPLSEALKRE